MHRGKMVLLYKRPGHRVIINMYGDMIVRPTFAEASTQVRFSHLSNAPTVYAFYTVGRPVIHHTIRRPFRACQRFCAVLCPRSNRRQNGPVV